MSVLELTKNLEKIVDKFNLTEMVELYKNEFEIIELTSSNAPLNSLEKIIFQTKNYISWLYNV